MEHSPLGRELKDDNFERLPGAGKGGMVQLASAGNFSMLVSAGDPPLMINPVMEKVHEIQRTLN